jgi:hypothetical protein
MKETYRLVVDIVVDPEDLRTNWDVSPEPTTLQLLEEEAQSWFESLEGVLNVDVTVTRKEGQG